VTARLLWSTLLIATVVVLTFGVPLGIVAARLETQALEAALERDAVVIAQRVEEALEAGAAAVDPGIEAYLSRGGARVLVVDARGLGVYDSDAAPGVAQRDYSTRPEVVDALAGTRVSGVRRSDTLDTDLRYVAVPVVSGDRVLGAVRVTFDARSLDQRVRAIAGLLAGVGLVSLALTAVVGLLLARWLGRPVAALGESVSRFTAGDHDARADPTSGPPEIRELAQRVNGMAGRLTALLASQSAFVADASHQLRSPLHAIRLELETAVSAGAAPGEERTEAAAVERAVGEVARLSRTVDGLLALARAEAGGADVVEVDVAAVVAGRVELWTALAEEQEVRLAAEGPVDATALAVPGHLEQVLDNLIDNALEVAPAGTEVTVRCRVRGTTATIEVDDAGPGLGTLDPEQAFERFRSTRGTTGGSGLGLPIARALARAGGGDVTLHRSPAGGVRARVSLVRRPAAP
jgi:signal transduction histidine kinase